MYQKFKRLVKRKSQTFTAVKNVFDNDSKSRLVIICEAIQESTQADQVLISVLDGDTLRTRAATGIDVRELALSASPASALMGDTDNDSILVNRSAVSGAEVAFLDELEAQSFFGYKIKGSPHALISLYSAKPDFSLSERQARTLYSLARLVSVDIASKHKSSIIEIEKRDDLRDPVTGLYTYRALKTHLEHQSRGTDDLRYISLAVVKPLNFNRINRLYGRAAGNRVLQDITERLKAKCPKASYFARLHGNRFGIMLAGAEFAKADVGECLKDVLGQPFEVEGLEVFLNFAIGNLPIDLFQPLSLSNLLDWADSVIDAMKVESHHGVTVVNFSASLNEALEEEAYLEKALHRALKK